MSAIAGVVLADKSLGSADSRLADNHLPDKYATGSSSIWSNILYGIAMIAYLTLPPMIPGVTSHGLIVFNVGLVIMIYIVALLVQVFKVMKLNRRRK